MCRISRKIKTTANAPPSPRLREIASKDLAIIPFIQMQGERKGGRESIATDIDKSPQHSLVERPPARFERERAIILFRESESE